MYPISRADFYDNGNCLLRELRQINLFIAAPRVLHSAYKLKEKNLYLSVSYHVKI